MTVGLVDKGKIAVVTGAAGGMGAATAGLLAAGGWPLLLCDLDMRRLEAVAAGFGETVSPTEILAGDIDDPAFAGRLGDAVGAREIGIFVHAAGLSPTMAEPQRILRVNFDATARLVNIVRPRMSTGGCAVLISSSSAYQVRSDELDRALDEAVTTRSSAALQAMLQSRPELAYPASKRAVIRLVAREAPAFGERGARIVSISPGLIDTAMTRAEQIASDQMQQMLVRTPLKRLGNAEEIATVAIFLCSPGASYVSGCDIPVDGGMLAALGLL